VDSGWVERADFQDWWQIPTRSTDNDQYGHFNSAVYYTLFDTVIAGWLTHALGVDPVSLGPLDVVAESACRYLRELHHPDVIDAGLRVDQLGRASVTYGIGLFGQGDDHPAAFGRVVYVYVDPKGRRPTRIPQSIRDALETLRAPAL
jgi:acyl-CoA thioester hydrolase